MATSSHAVRDLQGNRGTSEPGRACSGPPRSSTAHTTAMTHAERDSATSAPRQPPRRPASGTAIAAATVAPIWIPVV